MPPANQQGIFLLVLNGEDAGFLTTADFPTETLLTIEFGFTGMSRATYEWIGESLVRPRSRSGCLISFDYSLKPVYFDLWDSGYINQIVFPALDVSSNYLLKLQMAVRIANLHQEASARHHAPKASGHHRRDPLPSFVFQVRTKDRSCFVSKISALSVPLGPDLAGQFTGSGTDLVLTMGEQMAADFRTWKQMGDARDLAIDYMDTAFRVIATLQFKRVTISHIHPAAPLSPYGITEVAMRFGQVTFNYPA